MTAGRGPYRTRASKADKWAGKPGKCHSGAVRALWGLGPIMALGGLCIPRNENDGGLGGGTLNGSCQTRDWNAVTKAANLSPHSPAAQPATHRGMVPTGSRTV